MNFSPSNRLEVGPVARLDSTRRGRDNFSSVWGKNLHADTETKFRTEPPIFAIFFLLDKFSIRFMVSDPRIRIERKKLSSKRGGYEDRCGRIARFLWSFFSFFYDRAARGIHIVSRRVHSWWDAFQRIVSFSLYSPLFSFVFSLFLFFLSFFFFGRALSSCIGSVLLIVTALSSFVDFENENAKVAFQPSNRPLFIASHPLAGRKLAESYFHGRRREREREKWLVSKRLAGMQ